MIYTALWVGLTAVVWCLTMGTIWVFKRRKDKS